MAGPERALPHRRAGRLAGDGRTGLERRAVRASKRVIGNRRTGRRAQVFDRQAEILEQIADSLDAREGALAFTQKRPAVWHAR